MSRSLHVALLTGVAFACAQPQQAPGIPKSSGDYVAEANAVVESLSAADAITLLGDSSVAFVDLREQSELDEAGWIPHAVHAPRGLLEFYIDPSSFLHKDVFSSNKRIVFYCAGGGRSALAAKLAMDMGLSNVAHIEGGFRAWQRAGGPVAVRDHLTAG